MSKTPRVVNAYAAIGPELTLKPWTYLARPLGSEDVEIQISHCGICGTDLHTIDGWGNTTYPCVVGHEIIGIVTEIGDHVMHLRVGDRVGVGAQVFACLNKDPCTPCSECATDHDAYCNQFVFTYNDKMPTDGAITYGGYADYVRVLSHYAFKIPDNIPSDQAAPLMCAGVTVFSPLKHHQVQPGDRVGVVGIGGLGHLALQFIRALGAVPVAISNSPSKEDEAKHFGAQVFINMRDNASIERNAKSLTHLLMTADANDLPYDTYMSFLKPRGKFILLGIPNDRIQFSPWSVIMPGISFHGSLVGGMQDVKEMLEVASKQNVRPMVQKLPMSQATEGVRRVHDGKARYRVVLENPML